MDDPIRFDPGLAMLWPSAAAARAPYGAVPAPNGQASLAALLLETKAAEEPAPGEAARNLLNAMTDELRQQFEVFSRIRANAELKLDAGDDAEQKLARADIKSSNDAVSLIARTIEKIDSLQRSLARDLDPADAEPFDAADYAALLDDIDRRIEVRAEERMRIWLAERGESADRSGTTHRPAGPPGSENSPRGSASGPPGPI